MTPDTIPQTVLFPDLFAKPLVATFDREQASSDGGAVLLKAAERVYGHCQVADERAFFSLGAERPSLGQQAHVTSSH